MSIRYQYLAGGANTGSGWASWTPDGMFVQQYVEESRVQGLLPVLVYYMLRQPAPSSAKPDPVGVRKSRVREHDACDQRRPRTSLSPGRRDAAVVLHFEPDPRRYTHQRSRDDDADSVLVAVSASGHAELAALPNDASGMALALARLRDRFATNVQLAYHLSLWGTGTDPIYADPRDAQLDALAYRSAEFCRSLNRRFDIAFGEFSDRDSACKQDVHGDGCGGGTKATSPATAAAKPASSNQRACASSLGRSPRATRSCAP